MTTLCLADLDLRELRNLSTLSAAVVTEPRATPATTSIATRTGGASGWPHAATSTAPEAARNARDPTPWWLARVPA